MTGVTHSGRSLAWVVPIVAEAAALARSVAFAWLLGPDEMGQAMMLALTVRMVEMASDFGIERLIVQTPEGQTERFQAALHGAMILRGVMSAIVLLGLAPVFALGLADGPAWESYALLAIVPLLRGLAHLDYRRFERRFHYQSMAIVEGGATVAMAAAMLPAGIVFQDHRAMILVLILHAASFALLSHAVAARHYQALLSVQVLHHVRRFGAPLVANAMLLFMAFYADRLIVAEAYGWAVLAVYGIALQLAMLPAQVAGRAAASLLLPRLAQAFHQNRLLEVWHKCMATFAVGALIMVVGFVLCAPIAIDLTYGAAYRPDLYLTLGVALAAGFRILRTPLSQLAVATGRTGDPARANVLRALAILPAAVSAAAGLPLAVIAFAAAAGEAAATFRAVWLSRTVLHVSNSKEVLA